MSWLANKEKITWEPAASLPQSVIDEFENEHQNHHVITTTETSYGRINCTLNVAKCNPPHTPLATPPETTVVASEPRYVHGTCNVHVCIMVHLEFCTRQTCQPSRNSRDCPAFLSHVPVSRNCDFLSCVFAIFLRVHYLGATPSLRMRARLMRRRCYRAAWLPASYHHDLRTLIT